MVRTRCLRAFSGLSVPTGYLLDCLFARCGQVTGADCLVGGTVAVYRDVPSAVLGALKQDGVFAKRCKFILIS